MTIHIISDNYSLESPGWGEPYLETYFLSEWNKPHPDPSQSEESPTDRRKRLLRQWLALGFKGRKPYMYKSNPTETQIEEILRPIRPDILRACGDQTGSTQGCWLRLCYTNEEGHKALWEENEEAEWVTHDGLVLDDESIFGGLDLAEALEIFTERITNERVDLQERDDRLREELECLYGSSDDEDEDEDEEKGPRKMKKFSKLEYSLDRYSFYFATCVVTHLYVEDEVAVNGGGVLHVFLDDFGNVVRHWRVQNDGSESNYDGYWFERVWRQEFESNPGEMGPAYQVGGSRGPPYLHVGPQRDLPESFQVATIARVDPN